MAKLTPAAIDALKKNRTRLLVCLALDVTEMSVRTLIKENRENGKLTTPDVLAVIAQEAELPQSALITAAAPVPAL